MGNADGIAVRPPWDRPVLFNVVLAFLLDGERAVVYRLHASMSILREKRVESIQVRVDYPDRSHAPIWEQGDQPAGDVFYLPVKRYTREELIEAIRQQHQERCEQSRQREITDAEEEAALVKRRAELDSVAGDIAQQI